MHEDDISHFSPKRVMDVPSGCLTSTQVTVSTDSKENLRLFLDKSCVQLDSSTSPKLNDISDLGILEESTSRVECLNFGILQTLSIC